MTSDVSVNNKRIAKNTLFLYIRMLFTMAVGLYTSRVILETLGVSDYGLYNVVGGFVSMFMFVNGQMTIGSQRFLSYALGEHNDEKLQKVFSNAIIIHFSIAVLIFVFAETLGLWFLENKINIDSGRSDAAFWVYQFSVLAAIVQVLQVPFQSTIVAHEEMGIYAYVSVFDAVMKLAILFLIQIMSHDKLILYGFFILIVQMITSLVYCVYANRKYEECRVKPKYDKKTLTEMFSFSSWGLIGSLAGTCQGQGVNVLLNIFYGTIVNAARGIAFQVNNVLLMFAHNFQIAVSPQIIKYYASGEKEEMAGLVIRCAKISAILLLLLMMPIMIDTDFVLGQWLGNYPEYTSGFVKIICIQTIMQAIIHPVIFVTYATGKIKMPNLTGGLCVMLALPLCYFSYRFGADPYTVLIVSIIPWLGEQFFDLYYARKFAGFPMAWFYLDVYVRFALLGGLVYVIISLLYSLIHLGEWIGFIIMILLSCFVSAIFYLFGGLTKKERLAVVELVKHKISTIV